MAALYADEEEIWKCQRHPSRRRRTGICHVCLREKLTSLCPDCADARPCSCGLSSSNSTDKSSTSASSSLYSVLSRFTSYATGNSSRMGSASINSSVMEPSFGRSRSVAVQSFRLTSENNPTKSSTPLWSIFKGGSGSRSKRVEAERERGVLPTLSESENGFMSEEDSRRRMMNKSRSVAVTTGAGLVDVGGRSGRHKGSVLGRGWNFPSPMKALKNTIPRNGTVRERPQIQKS